MYSDKEGIYSIFILLKPVVCVSILVLTDP